MLLEEAQAGEKVRASLLAQLQAAESKRSVPPAPLSPVCHPLPFWTLLRSNTAINECVVVVVERYTSCFEQGT